MSEIDNREQELLNPDLTDEQIDEILNADSEDNSNDEAQDDSNPLQEDLKKKDAIIRQLLARAKNAEAKSKNIDKPIIKKQTEKKDDIHQTIAELKLAEDKRQFGYENSLSPEETDYIFRINPNPTKDLLADPFIKGGLEAVRAKKRAENNTPSLNSRSQKFQVPNKKDLTPKDKQEAFESFMKNRFSK